MVMVATGGWLVALAAKDAADLRSEAIAAGYSILVGAESGFDAIGRDSKLRHKGRFQ